MVQSKQLFYKDYPRGGYPEIGKHIEVITRDIDTSKVPSGGIIIKSQFASLDPYMRGRMRPTSVKSYSPPFPPNTPITTRLVGVVEKSENSKFKEGAQVIVFGPLSEYIALSGEEVEKFGVQLLDNPNHISASHYIGAVGMPGLTAYSSLYDIGQPKKGESIFVSAASGAVGAIVGQIAKHEGLKVYGSVGSEEKKKYVLEELGFDGCTNYKEEKTSDALKRMAPDGIDIFYDNVGGEILEASIDHMNDFGRIVACGQISQYNAKPGELYGVKNTMLVVGKRITWRGFIQGDANMGPKYAKEHAENVSKWIADGSFKAKEHFVSIDESADALIGLFKGQNFGKLAVKL